MHSSKLFKVLAALEEGEWLDFRNHLKSNTQQKSKVLSLYLYIFKKRQVLDSNKLAMSEVRTQISGYRSEKYIRNLMSQILGHLENYLIYSEFQSQEDEQKLYLFSALNKRGLYKLANNYASKLRIEWADPFKENHRNIERLLRLNHSHFLSNNPLKRGERFNILFELIKSFNTNTKLLEYYYDFLLINEKILTNSNEIELSKREYGHYFESENSILQTYKNLLKILNEDENAFSELFEKLISDKITYSDELSILVYTKCRIFITAKVGKGEYQYSKKLLAIFELGIERGYLLYKGRMSLPVFYNLFSVACGLNEIEWAKDYLEKYINLIPSSVVLSINELAIAEIKFVEFNYFDSIQRLNQVELLNIGMKLRQRWLLLCAHYVVYDDYSFIDAQINNYNQFFYYNRSKISAANFESGLNLGRVIRQLVTGEEENEILKQISDAKRIAFRLRLPTIIEQRKIYAKKMGLNY